MSVGAANHLMTYNQSALSQNVVLDGNPRREETVEERIRRIRGKNNPNLPPAAATQDENRMEKI